MRGTPTLRHQVAEVSRFLHDKGWVANHDGNVTARDGARFIATPTATSKRLITDRELIEVDAKGQVLGHGKVFGEIGLHLIVYERRRDVNAVVHAHPPYATAISAARGNPIETPFIAEAVVSLGARIPKIPFAIPGEPARQALAPWCELVDAVIVGNHGVFTWGKDPEQALLRMELVEHLARIAIEAAPLGGIEPLPETALQPLLAARAKAGIGYAADRAVETAGKLLGRPGASEAPPSLGKPIVACAPAPHANVATMSPSGVRHDAPQDLASIVRDEIVRALRKS